MRNYWEASIKHLVTGDDGKLKKTTSVYLIDAINHTEVEARLVKEMAQIIRGDFKIKPIRASDVVEVVDDSLDYYWKVKFEYFDEKKVTKTYLVSANSVTEAIDLFVAEMSNFMLSYEIVSVTKTKILNVYLWEPKGFEVDITVDWGDGNLEKLEDNEPEELEGNIDFDQAP